MTSMAHELVVALIGATGDAGREVRRALRERQFPLRDLRLLAAEDLAEIDDEDAQAIEPLEGADLSGVDLVFMCATPEITRAWLARAHAADAMVIDTTHAFADVWDVPLVVPEVNADIVPECMAGGIISTPVSGAVALSIVLKPLAEAAGLKRVVVAGYESASSVGPQGVEELSRQTVDLLNGRSTDTGIFPHRIAFNLIPQVGAALADGVSVSERRVELQTRRLLSLSELPITVTSVYVPTFFGEGYALNVEMETPLDAGAARALLREAPGILVTDEPQAHAYPTLVEAVDAEATLVGRIRDDHSAPFGLNLWVVIDGSRKGGAINAVHIAELLARGS